MTPPFGNVTEVLPSYHRCISFGTSIGAPGMRSGRPRTARSLAPLMATGVPHCAMTVPLVCNPPTMARTKRFAEASPHVSNTCGLPICEIVLPEFRPLCSGPLRFVS